MGLAGTGTRSLPPAIRCASGALVHGAPGRGFPRRLPYDSKWSNYRLVLTPGDLSDHEDLITGLIAQAKSLFDA